jgi:hypothetical protein
MWSWRQWRCSCQSQVTLLVRTGKSVVCTTRDSAAVKTNATPNAAFFVGNNFCYDSKNFLRKVEDLMKWLSKCITLASVNNPKIKAHIFHETEPFTPTYHPQNVSRSASLLFTSLPAFKVALFPRNILYAFLPCLIKDAHSASDFVLATDADHVVRLITTPTYFNRHNPLFGCILPQTNL